MSDGYEELVFVDDTAPYHNAENSNKTQKAIHAALGYADKAAVVALGVPDCVFTIYINSPDGGRFVWVESSSYSDVDGCCGWFISVDGTAGWERIEEDIVKARHFGGIGDGVTDDTLSIQKAIDFAITVGKYKSSQLYLDKSAYVHFGELFLKGVKLVGNGVLGTELKYKNVAGGTGISITPTPLTETVNYGGMSNTYILGDELDGPDVSLDITGGSYHDYHNFTIQNKRSGAVLIKGVGNTGASPYYNVFDSFSLFGGSDNNQTGFLFDEGIWAGGSNGPNANHISNLKRAAGLYRVFDIKSGIGNTGVNIGGESIHDAFFVFNDRPALATGTATSGSANSLTDTSASLAVNQFINGGVKIISGTGAGQARYVDTNSATSIVVSPTWGIVPDSTSVYELYTGKTTGNKFTNIRQEGLASSNPDFIRNICGSSKNKVDNYVVESLGSGELINDEQGDQSNNFLDSDKVVFKEHVSNLGASASIDLWPRLSVFGGVSFGGSYRLVSIEILSANHATGTVTATLDAGGTGAGNGSSSVQVQLTPTNTKQAVMFNLNYKRLKSVGAHSFLNISSDSSVNSTSDYTVITTFAVEG